MTEERKNRENDGEEGMEKRFWRFIERIPWFWLGLIAALFLVFPYAVLGRGAYVQITDQLDGEVLNYIYQAKYLFSGKRVIPELMNGVGKSAMTPPAPLGVLFYRFLQPFAAFAVFHAYVVVAGYTGMYLWSRRLTGSKGIAFVVAGIFVYLPFYPVYGLSILGQPLLLWALCRICERQVPFPAKWKYYLCVLLYAVSSSLALIGFVWVAVLLAGFLWSLFQKREISRDLGVAFLVLTAVFLVCNIGLVGQFLGIGERFVPHREEMVIAARPDWQDYFREIFLQGGPYGKSYNAVIVLLTAGILAVHAAVRIAARAMKKTPVLSEEPGDRGLYGGLAALFVLAFLVAAAAVLWRSPWVVELRMQVGGAVKYFQADRVYWLLPLCWYSALALDLYILLRRWRRWERFVLPSMKTVRSITISA